MKTKILRFSALAFLLVFMVGCASLGIDTKEKKQARKVTKQKSLADGQIFEANVEEVKDINQIIAYGVLTTPGLVLNGELVCSGRVPTKTEISQFITAALDKEKKHAK